MKLHLPIRLLVSVLACLYTVVPVSVAAEIVSVNFCDSDSRAIPDTNELLLGVEASTWNNIVSPGTTWTTYDVTSTSGNTYQLSLLAGRGTWQTSAGVETLESTLLASYVDVASYPGASYRFWSLAMAADVLYGEMKFYLANDVDSQFVPLWVNGTLYVGGATASNVAESASSTWGSNSSEKSVVDEDNTLTVSLVASDYVFAENVVSNSNRATLAGFQLIDATEEVLWVAPEGSQVDVAEALFSRGESTSSLEEMAEGDRNLGFANQTVTFGSGTTSLDAIQAMSGTVTVTSSGTLAVDYLHAKAHTTLQVDAALATDHAVTLGGCGTVNFMRYGSYGSLTNNTNTEFSAAAFVTSLTNNDTVHFHEVAMLGAFSNAGLARFDADAMVNALDTEDFGTLQVAAGKTLTIAQGDFSGGNDCLVRLLGAALADEQYGGTVKLTGDLSCHGNIDNGGTRELEIHGHYEIDGTLRINSWHGITTRVREHGSLSVDGLLAFLKQQTFVVEGGRVDAQEIRLGHTDPTGDCHGTMLLTDGLVQTQSISLQNGSSYASLFEMTGGTLAFTQKDREAFSVAGPNSEVRLLGGILSVANSGWYTQGIDLTLGAVSLEGGGEGHDITFLDGTSTLVGTVANHLTDGARFQLKNALVIDDVAALETTGELAYSEGANGYLVANYALVKGGEGSVTVISDTVTVDGVQLAVQTNDAYATTEDNLLTTTGDTYVSVAGTSGGYYVNSGTVHYVTGETVAADSTTSVHLNGGNLNMVENLRETATGGIVVERDSTVTLGEGTELAHSSLTFNAGTVALAGRGAYVVTSMGALAQLSGLQAEDWTGTLSMRGVALASADLNSYGNAGSTIELINSTGHLARADSDAGKVYGVKLRLTGDEEGHAAMTFNNGWAGDKHTFTGSVSGDGDIVRMGDKGTVQTFTFTGDVSGWTGRFSHENTRSAQRSVVIFSGEATTINAGIHAQSSSSALALTVENDAAVAVNGDITGNVSVTFRGAGDKTVSGTGNTYTGNTTVESGAVVVAANHALGYGNVTLSAGALKVGVAENGEGYALSNTIAAGSVATFTADGEAATYANVELSSTGISSLGEGASISHATITLAADYSLTGTTLTACSVNVGSSVLTLAEACLGEGSTVTVGEGGALSATGSLLEGTVRVAISQTADGGLANASGTLDYGDLTYTTVNTRQLNGMVLTLASEVNVTLGGSLAEALAAKSHVALIFEGLVMAGRASGDGIFTLSEEMADCRIAGVVYQSGNTVVYVTTQADSPADAVPEPTSATLSLLGLVALVARRRRRG